MEDEQGMSDEQEEALHSDGDILSDSEWSDASDDDIVSVPQELEDCIMRHTCGKSGTLVSVLSYLLSR